MGRARQFEQHACGKSTLQSNGGHSQSAGATPSTLLACVIGGSKATRTGGSSISQREQRQLKYAAGSFPAIQ
jgi:hypothetical protein